MTASGPPADHVPDLSELRTLALFIAMDVSVALQAGMVMHASKAIFYQDKTRFRCHPANTFQYMALEALEERSIVRISENVAVAAPIMGLGKDLVSEWATLKPHRHYVSHPATIDWTHASMREFVAEKRQYTEIRPALIWQAQARMNERLQAAGLEPHAGPVEVTWAMTGMLYDIFMFSMEGEALNTLGSRGQWHEQLTAYRDRFMEYIATRRSIVPTPDPVAES